LGAPHGALFLCLRGIAVNRSPCGNKDNPQSPAATAPFRKEPFGCRLTKAPFTKGAEPSESSAGCGEAEAQ